MKKEFVAERVCQGIVETRNANINLVIPSVVNLFPRIH